MCTAMEAVLREQATRVLYSDIDGTLAHYMPMTSSEDGRTLSGEGITLEQEPDDGEYCGTFRCTRTEVLYLFSTWLLGKCFI